MKTKELNLYVTNMKKTKTDYKKFAEASKRVAKAEAEAEEGQKPSEMIRQLVAIIERAQWVDEMSWITAILAYLDMQYEKENHERKRD